jgi:iron complex outermembrane receptor protein
MNQQTSGQTRPYSVLLISILAASLLLTGMNAVAQVLEEIVVTAQKRSQNIQDVGIAITAFTGDQVREFGMLDTTQIPDMAPGVQLVQPNSRQSYGFSVRGVHQVDFADHQEHPTAVYVDEAYISQASASGFQLFDLEQVEILRGPQGTLWGRNATGGAISVTTNKPSQEFDAYIEGKYGSYDNMGMEFGIGGGLTDRMSVRFSGKGNWHDAYAENTVGEDQFDDNTASFRGQVLFEISDDVTLLLNGRGSSSEVIDGAAHTQPASFDPDTGFGYERGPNEVTTNLGVDNAVNCPGCDFFGWAEPDDGRRTVSHEFIGFSDLHTWGGGARLDVDAGNFDFVSITDWYHVDKEYMEDSDNTPFPVLETFLANNTEQFSQEIRLSGETERVRWVTGGYYLRIRGDYGTGVTLRSDVGTIGAEPSPQDVGSISPADSLIGEVGTEIPCFGGGGFEDLPQTCGLQPTSHDAGILLASGYWEQETDSYSIFAQTEFDLTSQLTLTTGFRWIEEEKEIDYIYLLDIWPANEPRGFLAPAEPAAFLVVHNKDSAGDLAVYDEGLWSAKVGIDWQVNDDLLTYFTFNRGVKGGGFNGSAVGDALRPEQVPIKEEILKAYEIGFKQTLWDNRLRVNGTAFYYDYEDFQAFIFEGQANFIANQDAEIYGAELEIEGSPVEGLNFMGGVGYLQGEVYDVTFPFTDPNTGREFTQPLDRELPRAPEWSVNGMVRYQWPAALENTGLAGNFAVQADFNWRSDQNMLLSEAPIGEQKAYVVGNARASYTSADGRWEAAFMVHNIANQFYCTQIYDVGADFNSRQCFFNRPRWFAGTLRINY